jgi:hypothetical protein
MKKKSTDRSAFLGLRILVVLILCGGAFLIATGTLPAFLRGDAASKIAPRTFTFAERVAYERAIENVYWRHRIWPKERPDTKPSLKVGVVLPAGNYQKTLRIFLPFQSFTA